jgi:hypothetical protein
MTKWTMLNRCIGVLIGLVLPFGLASVSAVESSCQRNPQASQQRATINFLVMAGGGAPSYNEIALEKNVLYFQRTLQALGFNPAAVSTFFANGSDGQATVRYMSGQKELFKVPEIPHLAGASTLSNFQNWMQQIIQGNDYRPIFFYFTGHGYRNPSNLNNNAMILWQEELLSVRQFTASLDRLPQDVPVVAMMSQCYSGSFANFIYRGGDPAQPIALQTRCGFFATIKSRPSVGCTPEVNEADYRDYSSSFFAGLSGRDRTGQPIASADYNQDGSVSYAEAHAFAKVDEQSTDLPVSTLEVWLQEQAGNSRQQILSQPIASLLASARPEQNYVVNALVQKFDMNVDKSYLENGKAVVNRLQILPEQEAYLTRLGMELINIGMEKQLREQNDVEKIAVIDRLIECESGSW